MADINQVSLEDVKKKVRGFIVENFLFGSEEDPFTDEDSFLENGIIDSTGVLELIEFIEEQYKIKAEDDELVTENLDSVNNVSRYLMSKLGNGQSHS
ncbi:MAG: acyl carrier protein [Spirochaetota bacterium]